ncbi:CRISPR-associated helicase Cas3' [Paucibacter sp. XJ19-41]|uniref:CRISPR-associated helicase Cas3' n=1 Tax=Paucibacter sp. XJ19-41 TaxID=2927824 RepID=UPI00234969BE|nr:CRISPR-associated helicase Cas3' [Paucibacter sp. XJ19-41]MDC6166474.1 CRISPR-associated helicase Cas3' [Paucibacter sp. XJ19-41]
MTLPPELQPPQPVQKLSSEWPIWGKLQRNDEGGVSAIHSLIDHMLDVAACFIAMTECEAIRRALNTTAGRALQASDLQRLAVLVLLHDIGKCCPGFQAKYWPESVARKLGWPVHSGHGAEGWTLFESDDPRALVVVQGLPLTAMNDWGEAVLTLLHASISHHGKPVQVKHNSQDWAPVWQAGQLIYDPAAAVARIGQTCLDVYPLAFKVVDAELPDSPAFTHIFAGLVQLADWLGSDTRDGFFPYSLPGENRALSAPDRARYAVRVIGLDVLAQRLAVNQQPPSFFQAFDLPGARPMQAAMSAKDLGPVAILEAETGSGKTEAALWRFLHLFQRGEVDSLYFALPTRVAATQIHQRVRDFASRVWPAGTPLVVRALPGYEAADEALPQRLPGYRVLWSDSPGDAQSERRWAVESPKRYLAATIAVGTVDQALLAALPLKHAHLRHAMLARSLLVVDEVHASDAYMTALLEQLLRAHVACGGQALLLSATLGAVARSKFLSIGTARRSAAPTLLEALRQPYPALSTQVGGFAQVRTIEGNPRHKEVSWHLLDEIDQPERIAARALEAAQRGARVLVIRNTVPAAVATLRALEALLEAQDLSDELLFKVNGIATLHHSRFSRQERPLLDDQVQAQMGKQRVSPGGRILIGTQTLEQSLDIDADLLITDLCPMDVLLQRLGRLHRHARPSAEQPGDVRPMGFETAQAWVLTPAGHDLTPLLKRMQHGLGPLRSKGKSLDGVYLDLRIIEATRRLIAAQPSRQIPADNRLLVEQATHPEGLDLISKGLGEAWQQFGQEVDGSTAAKASLGGLQALAYTQGFGEHPFPEAGEQLATRLGAADRLLVFGDQGPPVGPFGVPVRQLAVRHHQVPRGLSPDAEATDVGPLGEGSGFAFSWGDARFRYSRFGLERLTIAVEGGEGQ